MTARFIHTARPSLRTGLGLLALALVYLVSLGATQAKATTEQKFCWNVVLNASNTYCTATPNGPIYSIAAAGVNGAAPICAGTYGAEAENGVYGCEKSPGEGVYFQNLGGVVAQYAIIRRGNVEAPVTVHGTLFWGSAPPPPPSWHAAESLGGTLTSEPDISSWGPGRLDVFAKGAENGLSHKYWDGTGWSTWENLGGTLASGPSAVSWGPNRIDVVARMADNTIGHWYWAGAGWGFDNLGGNITSNPDISSWGGNRLDIFGRGPSGELQHRAWSAGWFPWESLGGNIIGGPGAVSWGQGRIDVAARTPSNGIAHWYWSEGWHQDTIPGTITADPELSSLASSRLDLFTQTSVGGTLQHKWWVPGSGWSVWEGLGGPALVGGPGAVSWASNRIDVVGRAPDNSITHWWWGS